MSNEILISVNEVYRYYGNYCAVNNASFTVKRGEVLGFLGLNGAGKSTTMQIISGVLCPSSGSVSIAGFDILDVPRQAKSQLGFLPEQPPLYHDLTVDEYLDYAARLRGISRTNIRTAIEKSKQRCGLDMVGNRLINNLSKGYQQRVGIAQAILHSPAVIILDEPTNGLDPVQIKEIRELIKELGQDHSVILSTHILPEVQTICDRVLIIHEGQLVLDRQLENINSGKQNYFITVAFNQAPSQVTFNTIEGIKNIEQISDQRFRFELHPGSAAIDHIVRNSARSGWGLFEIIPETGSLEETFMHLTSGAQEIV
jgi:ABC-2 type transport system ATP-binding protein